jgi:hypothetical protein
MLEAEPAKLSLEEIEQLASRRNKPSNLNPAIQTAKNAEYAEGHELTIGGMFTHEVSRSYARCPAFFRMFRVFRGSICLFQVQQSFVWLLPLVPPNCQLFQV